MRLTPSDLSEFENKTLEQTLRRELKMVVATKEFNNGRVPKDIVFASEDVPEIKINKNGQ